MTDSLVAECAETDADSSRPEPTTQGAWFYRELPGGHVICDLCHHDRDPISPGQLCPCGARENRDGKLVTLDYGRLVACNIDTIEKRGLFHFYPGSQCLSYGAPGCNLQCQFCQNWDLSQACKREDYVPNARHLSPRSTVRLAALHGCLTVAAAYTEPTVFFEYAFDTARHAREAGMKSVWATNGQMRQRPLETIAPCLDAVGVDLKCFSESTYQSLCHGHLKPVLRNLTRLKELGVHVEVNTPIIPGINDSTEELKLLTGFLASLDPDIPWHPERFHPDFRMEDVPMTPNASLRRAHEIAREAGLRFVYGSTPGCSPSDTHCSSCGTLVIKRLGAQVQSLRLQSGCCPKCGERLPGVGLDTKTAPETSPRG